MWAPAGRSRNRSPIVMGGGSALTVVEDRLHPQCFIHREGGHHRLTSHAIPLEQSRVDQLHQGTTEGTWRIARNLTASCPVALWHPRGDIAAKRCRRRQPAPSHRSQQHAHLDKCHGTKNQSPFQSQTASHQDSGVMGLHHVCRPQHTNPQHTPSGRRSLTTESGVFPPDSEAPDISSSLSPAWMAGCPPAVQGVTSNHSSPSKAPRRLTEQYEWSARHAWKDAKDKRIPFQFLQLLQRTEI